MTDAELRSIGEMLAGLWPAKWGRATPEMRASMNRVVGDFEYVEVEKAIKHYADTNVHPPAPIDVTKAMAALRVRQPVAVERQSYQEYRAEEDAKSDAARHARRQTLEWLDGVDRWLDHIAIQASVDRRWSVVYRMARSGSTIGRLMAASIVRARLSFGMSADDAVSVWRGRDENGYTAWEIAEDTTPPDRVEAGRAVDDDPADSMYEDLIRSMRVDAVDRSRNQAAPVDDDAPPMETF